MDPLTKYILEQVPKLSPEETLVAAKKIIAKLPKEGGEEEAKQEQKIEDDPDKAVEKAEKGVKQRTKDTEEVMRGMKSVPTTAEQIMLEFDCPPYHTYNSLKKKCVKNPPYDEEIPEDWFSLHPRKAVQ